MADQHQRLRAGEAAEPVGQLRFGVFAGRVEGRGTGIAEAGDVPLSDLQVPPVEIVQSEAGAHAGDLVGRFVIAGQDVHPVGARLQIFAAAIEALAPGDLVAGGDVVIRLDRRAAVRAPSSRCGCRRR